MRRRSLLATLATVSTGAVAGCSRFTGPITSRSLTICEDDCAWREKTPEAGGEPVVERRPDEHRVVVYGHMYVGSSSCDRAVLETAELTDSTLRVVVGVGEKGLLPNLACTADMSADRYRVVVRFRDALPEDVVVEEQAVYNPDATETSTEG